MANVNKAQVNGTNRTKSTISFWIKRGKLSSDQKVFQFKAGSAEYLMKFKSNDQVNVYTHDGSSYVGRIETNNKFRDPASFYHFHIQVDTTDGTSADRFRFYVNGELQDDLLNSDVPSQNASFDLSTSSHHLYLGSQSSGGDAFDGTITHFHYTDGYSYAPTVFGETDSTSGIWKPKTAPSVTYGTNGVFLKFENSGAMGTDSSGNTNTYTVSGTLTQNVDTPSNNFSTLNFLDRWFNATNNMGDILSRGNNTFNTGSNSVKALARSSLGMLKGKYYCEVKIPNIDRSWIGICNSKIYTSATNNFWTTNLESGFFWYGNGTAIYTANDVSSNTYGGYANDDIVMMALDMDNYAFYLGKNGTWLNSGDPTSGSSKTGSVTGLTNFGTNPLTEHGEVFFMCADSSTSGTSQIEWNFGQGYFGTTQVASAGTSPSEGGIFEYNCPSGYQSLCTKGLNSF